MSLPTDLLMEIEAAFARRLPATLSILLERMAVQLNQVGDARSSMLRSASTTAYSQRVDDARVLFDAARMPDLRL